MEIFSNNEAHISPSAAPEGQGNEPVSYLVFITLSQPHCFLCSSAGGSPS